VTKVYLINTTLIVVCPNGHMMGEIAHSREAALERYFDICDTLDTEGKLDTDSSIL